MSERPYVIDKMISAKSIAARIESLAREIEPHYAHVDKRLWGTPRSRVPPRQSRCAEQWQETSGYVRSG